MNNKNKIYLYLKITFFSINIQKLVLLVRLSVFAVILILSSCTTMDENKANLVLNVSSLYGIKTLLPNIDMTPAGYDISGTGSTGDTFSFTSAQPPVIASNLESGDWNITVNGKNAAGTIIAIGEQTTTLFPGQSQSVDITVSPVEGFGSLDLTLLWTASEALNPSLTAELVPETGAEIPLTFTIDPPGTATYIGSDIPTGYYTLVVQLLDNGTLTMGAVEVVRVVDGQITSGTFEFYDINQLEGSIQVNITPVMNDPIVVTMSGQIAEFGVGGFMTVDASVPPETGNVVYVWYINGNSVATGESYTTPTDLAPGVYRIDVTAFTSDGSRAGSSTHNFKITQNNNIAEPLFTIDAETGNVSQWDSLTMSDGNTFTADLAAARSGIYGYKVALSSTAGDYSYAKKIISGQNEIYLQFYVFIPSNNYPMHNQTTERNWVIGHIEDDSENVQIVSLEMRGNSTNLQIYRLVYASNTMQWNLLYINEVLSYDTWHSIEIYTKVGDGDGAVGLWIDEVLKVSDSGFSNDIYGIESVMAGCLWSTNYTIDGEYFYIDDIRADTVDINNLP